MEYGTVIALKEKGALVLFEHVGIQKQVSIPKHIDNLQTGDRVAVMFEASPMVRGMIIGVVDCGEKDG